MRILSDNVYGPTVRILSYRAVITVELLIWSGLVRFLPGIQWLWMGFLVMKVEVGGLREYGVLYTCALHVSGTSLGF